MSIIRRTALVLLAIAVLATIVTWFARRHIADNALSNALAARGVQASYALKSIGFRWQRIENVRIGDPRDPDLTARWIEVRLGGGSGGVTATAVRAGGVRMKARLTGGTVSFGQIDRLLPRTDGTTPFALPDIDVDLRDARVRLDTGFGQVGVKVEGQGNLLNGFAGKIAAIAPMLRDGDCTGSRVTAYVDVVIRDRAPKISGPVRAGDVACRGVRVTGAAAALDVALNATLDRWKGTAALEASRLAGGDAALASITGRVGYEGNAADTRGTATLSAENGTYGANRLAGLTVGGAFGTGRGWRSDGTIKVAQVLPDRTLAGRVVRSAIGLRGTPVGPLADQIARSVAMASAGGVTLTIDAKLADGALLLSRLAATSQNGAALRLSGGSGLRFGNGQFLGDTQITLSGGGFPAVQSTFQRRADGMTLGLVRIAPLIGGGSRLALAPVRFAAKPSGAMLFETVATLDGPLGDGRIEGLQMPVALDIAASGAIKVNRGCTSVAFKRLDVSGLALSPTRLRLCPGEAGALVRFVDGQVSGGARVGALRVSGRLGESPIELAASGARFGLDPNDVAIDRLTARLGTADRLSRLDVGSLTGRIARGMIQGEFADASGNIAKLPLLVTKGAGNWQVKGGRLALRGGVTVSDDLVPGRFAPLVSNDIVLTLTDGRVSVTGMLRAPESGVDVANVAIAHDLGRGTGNAALDVAALRFGKALQPEALTRLTLGIVANVVGQVSGRGDIAWTPTGVTSTGRFATDNLDFAAAFGPVTGLKGEIVFDDLLALTTPPGQRVTIATVNPGTLVTEGIIRYQLVAGQQIAVEGGDWPFAGGQLRLEPTMLDMGRPSDRRLTFRVVALDAARFIEQLDFDNIAATGIFDGVLPMIFDESGGRIEDGQLTARKGGGTLAYVGEVSNTEMNVFANLAFDALKSIRYQNLTIDLNGALDGEIVSRVNFNGVNENPLSPPKSFIARQFIGLPFRFNITIRAPFRSLLNTARTFQDPSSLLQRTMPDLQESPVQPSESETKR